MTKVIKIIICNFLFLFLLTSGWDTTLVRIKKIQKNRATSATQIPSGNLSNRLRAKKGKKKGGKTTNNNFQIPRDVLSSRKNIKGGKLRSIETKITGRGADVIAVRSHARSRRAYVIIFGTETTWRGWKQAPSSGNRDRRASGAGAGGRRIERESVLYVRGGRFTTLFLHSWKRGRAEIELATRNRWKGITARELSANRTRRLSPLLDEVRPIAANRCFPRSSFANSTSFLGLGARFDTGSGILFLKRG